MRQTGEPDAEVMDRDRFGTHIGPDILALDHVIVFRQGELLGELKAVGEHAYDFGRRLAAHRVRQRYRNERRRGFELKCMERAFTEKLDGLARFLQCVARIQQLGADDGTGNCVDRDAEQFVFQHGIRLRNIGNLFQRFFSRTVRNISRVRDGRLTGGRGRAGICIRLLGRSVLLRGFQHLLVFLGAFRLVFRHVKQPAAHQQAAD